MAEAILAPPHGDSTFASSNSKLHGRAFYESIGSPKVIVAPMVAQSEFAWRMLSRSFMPKTTKNPLLAYTPMFHARLFADTPKYRESSIQPTTTGVLDPPPPITNNTIREYSAHLDGNAEIDRPLFVQFCANDPEKLLAAAKLAQPYCDAVDLNLGCPQGIARAGHYGAFLQEDQDLIYKLINTLHRNLDIPVTAKMRVLETREETLKYAKTILSAGASILTIHGRQRHQKGHNTGLADWNKIRFVRDNLPSDTVLFANGNILQYDDIQACLEATGVDGVMSAEGNLCDPAVLAPPPPIHEDRPEYWRGRNGKGGWRMDAVLRRYLDIIYQYVLKQPIPDRKPLFVMSDHIEITETADEFAEVEEQADEPPRKKQKKDRKNRTSDPNLTAMQAHLFQMLRPLISKHTHIRDMLARSHAGDMAAFERVLALVEHATKEGILDYEKEHLAVKQESEILEIAAADAPIEDPTISSKAAVARCKRPFWVCQPYIRPLPEEAIAKGALQMSKKDKKKLESEQVRNGTKKVEIEPTTDGAIESVKDKQSDDLVEVPKEAVVCG